MLVYVSYNYNNLTFDETIITYWVKRRMSSVDTSIKCVLWADLSHLSRLGWRLFRSFSTDGGKVGRQYGIGKRPIGTSLLPGFSDDIDARGASSTWRFASAVEGRFGILFLCNNNLQNFTNFIRPTVNKTVYELSSQTYIWQLRRALQLNN